MPAAKSEVIPTNGYYAVYEGRERINCRDVVAVVDGRAHVINERGIMVAADVIPGFIHVASKARTA